jgi:hypothetical protein
MKLLRRLHNSFANESSKENSAEITSHAYHVDGGSCLFQVIYELCYLILM